MRGVHRNQSWMLWNKRCIPANAVLKLFSAIPQGCFAKLISSYLNIVWARDQASIAWLQHTPTERNKNNKDHQARSPNMVFFLVFAVSFGKWFARTKIQWQWNAQVPNKGQHKPQNSLRWPNLSPIWCQHGPKCPNIAQNCPRSAQSGPNSGPYKGQQEPQIISKLAQHEPNMVPTLAQHPRSAQH